jgi:predicted dehydrogenase
MLKLGLISAATYGYLGAERLPGSHHGTAFATCFNGFDAEKVKSWKGTFVRSGRRLDDARIVRVWDPQREWAERLADICGIEKVCASPEECADGVDAVLVVDDGSGEHWKYAVAPLKKGVPTFCDKPLAMTAQDAREIGKLVRSTGTRFLSASSLRFVPDVVALKRDVASGALGEVHLATVACGNDLVYYGIHALEMAYAVLGKGAVSCINVGQPGLNIVRIRFANHHEVVLMVGDRQWMSAGYQIDLYGTKAWRTLKPDLKDLYYYLLLEFLEVVKNGKEPVPIEEEVEVIETLVAGRRSLEEKREVWVKE